MTNQEVARILREAAALLEIDGAQVGRLRSYERTAQIVDSLSEPVSKLIEEGRFTQLPGIGEGMQRHVAGLLATGKLDTREKLLKKFPAGVLDILRLQGLGPKKVAVLWKKFKVKTVADVGKLAGQGKLRGLAGFGEKTEQNILKSVTAFEKFAGRFHQHVAEAAAEKLIAYIQKLGKKVERVEATGSLRRGRETIGDLDLLVLSKSPEAVRDHILAFPDVQDKLAGGENKTSVRLTNGMQVDVRVLGKKSYGAALLYFTGSKAHNVVIRGRARERGWTLNEYALTTIKDGKWVAGRTEEEIYRKFGLAWIPPELRENAGELEAASLNKAKKSALPKLIELSDIRGDLQMHTTESDGKNSIGEMAEAARELGYEYIAITDHSKAVTVANGMDEKRTLAHLKRIRAADKKVRGIRILTGVEVDILKDGRLDLDEDVLRQLDVVVGSVHSYMNLEQAEMTDRLLRAIESGCLHILGHPTGRLLLRREAFRFDLEAILDACKRCNVAVESNAAPERLDLRDVDLRAAKDKGVKIVISTDAHTTRGQQWMKYGVRTARRAWLTRAAVINTLPTEKFLRRLSSN